MTKNPAIKTVYNITKQRRGKYGVYWQHAGHLQRNSSWGTHSRTPRRGNYLPCFAMATGMLQLALSNLLNDYGNWLLPVVFLYSTSNSYIIQKYSLKDGWQWILDLKNLHICLSSIQSIFVQIKLYSWDARY